MTYPYLHRLPLYLVICTACLASCGHDRPVSATDAPRTADTTPATGNYYKRLAGTVGERPVVLHLTVARDRYAGYCHYSDPSQPVALYAAADTGNTGFIRLDERSIADGSAEDSTQDHWLLRVGQDTAWGTWISGDGSVRREIRLRESYPAGSYPLEPVYESARAAYDETADTPFAVSTHSLCWPVTAGGKNAVDFIRRQFLQLAGCGQTAGPVSPDKTFLLQCIGEKNSAYFSDYRKSIAGAGMQPEELKQAFNNYSRDMYWDVAGNDDGWLILEIISGEYTGGAHGNYNVFYHCLDAAQQQVWTLENIMTVDSNQLKVLLDMAARRYFHIGASEPLQERLLTQEVPVTGNVWLAPAGLVFCYQPYEIASYADGVIPLFISYNELKHLLTDAFKSRMRLNGSAKATHT